MGQPNKYQYGFSVLHHDASYDRAFRERKARTIVAVCNDFTGSTMKEMKVLDVGASTGFLANYLADYFGHVTGIDIDQEAIRHAQDSFKKANLIYELGDAMNIAFANNSIDVVVCTQVYEHVPDAARMMREIERILKPGGFCYFAATNRFDIREHHYNLPFLSVIPRPLGHLYLRITGKGKYYYEKHLSYWGLKKIVRNFEINDYTTKVMKEPQKYFVDYMVKPGTLKTALAMFLLNHAYWLFPGYIWILKKRA